ncbi:MAG TPA: hypothetical protein VKZ61_01110 [Thermomicrobiales bacterium]|jgi:hypothetical protein|nr:hypothetical protein [Thermomicrobiales bacterium]
MKKQALPSEIYDEIEAMVIERFDEAWLTDKTVHGHFVSAMNGIIQSSDGVHLIGKPESGDAGTTFNLWLEYPVEEMWDADDLAFSIFGQVAEDIFISTREIVEGGVRYRFLTGTMENGHRGSLNLTGPHAKEFVHLYRLRVTEGRLYHA